MRGSSAIIATLLLALCGCGGAPPPSPLTQPSSLPHTMRIESPAFATQGMIPARYTCDGENRSPPLAISDVPPAARSIALIVDDPDAPMGTWLHWTVWNIDPKNPIFQEGKAPGGAVEGITSFGKPGYGGPCPP